MSNALMLSCLCAVLLLAQVQGFRFNDSLVGWYKGAPAATPLGPLSSDVMVWSVRKVDGDVFLMEDMFLGGAIPGSHQEFWVRDGILTYCGRLKYFFGSEVVGSVYNQFPALPQDPAAPNTRTWCGFPEAGGCSLMRWDMTLLNDTAFHLKVQIMPPTVHFDVVFVKQGAQPDAGYPSLPAADRKKCQLMASKTASYNWNSEDSPADNIKQQGGIATRAVARTHTSVASLYQHCYVINEVAGFILQWNVTRTGTVQLAMLAPAGQGNWVGLGFYPKFPGMKDARIIAGSVSCGAQLFQAEEWVGRPAPSNWTAVQSSSVTTKNGVLVLEAEILPPKYNKSYSTGETMMWAYGPADTDCLSYHSFNRGLFTVLDWSQPSLTLSPNLKCSN